jgi:hypothetical protein
MRTFIKRNLDFLLIVLVIFAALTVLAAEVRPQSSISRHCSGASPSPANAAVTINKDGSITVTTCAGKTFSVPSATWKLPDGSGGLPSLSFANDTDTGFYRVSANTLGFTVGGGAGALYLETTRFYPNLTSTIDLGFSSNAWRDLYVARTFTGTQGTITASAPIFSHTATWNAGGVTFHNFVSNVTNTASAAGSMLSEWQVGGTTKWGLRIDGSPTIDRTITAIGTTGAQTINKAAGTINVAAGAGSVVLTNSLIDANTLPYLTIRTADATCTSYKSAVSGAGTLTITMNANCTAATSIGFIITN